VTKRGADRWKGGRRGLNLFFLGEDRTGKERARQACEKSGSLELIFREGFREKKKVEPKGMEKIAPCRKRSTKGCGPSRTGGKGGSSCGKKGRLKNTLPGGVASEKRFERGGKGTIGPQPEVRPCVGSQKG